MMDSMEQDRQIKREFGRYRLQHPSPGLHDRVLGSAREAWASRDEGQPWLRRWLRQCGVFRQEILAAASMLLLILGAGLQLAGGRSVLADSIERWTILAAVSESLSRAKSMDCTVVRLGPGDVLSRYRVRWGASGITRVDLEAGHGAPRTLWIPDGTVPPIDTRDEPEQSTTSAPSEWKPSTEFLTPIGLARDMKRYGLAPARPQDGAPQGELRLAGQDGRRPVELTVDASTGLPGTLKKFPPSSATSDKGRRYGEEVRFRWNEPIPRELLIPGSAAGKQQVH